MILFVAPLSCALQYTKIDAVLTREELANEATLMVANRLAENSPDWWLWVIVGGVVTVISFAGLMFGSKNSQD